MLEAEAEAEAIQMRGEAEAFAVEAKAKAEAEQMAKKADAWKEYQEAAMVDMMLEVSYKFIKASHLGDWLDRPFSICKFPLRWNQF